VGVRALAVAASAAAATERIWAFSRMNVEPDSSLRWLQRSLYSGARLWVRAKGNAVRRDHVILVGV